MTVAKNKREHERYDLEASMVYAYHDSDLFYQARLRNYCKGGMCFLSGTALEPGSDIYIMMENLASDSVGAEFYDGYLAEVRWCSKSFPGNGAEFRVGIRYYQTVIK